MIERNKRALLALYGLGICAALLMSAIALANSTKDPATTAGSGAAQRVTASVLAVTIRPEYKLGSDGKRHDAYSQTEFALHAGRALTLRIDNTDGQPHSITSATAGVNIVAMPGTHVYTLLVRTPGHYAWRCEFNCDTGANGWAMTHRGYMSGFITVS